MSAENESLGESLDDARRRTLALVEDLSDEQLIGPKLPVVNPLLWEIGHVAWFQEKWVLRHAGGQAPIRADGDALFDSTAIPHEARWGLPLPARAEVLEYMQESLQRVLERLESGKATPLELYFMRYCVFHEDMHDEAFTYARQTLGYPTPSLCGRAQATPAGTPSCADRTVAAQVFELGARRDAAFVFDNEKWAHPVELDEFAIADAPVTQGEFAQFVADGGYAERAHWCERGWEWRREARAEHPIYWRGSAREGWQRRVFEHWVDLEHELPMIHVNWYEADAFCRWAGRRLPSEAEWEAAACAGHGAKPEFPWGDEPPNPRRALMDWRQPTCGHLKSCAEGISPLGLRHLIGNVWEWTATTFGPYPGFEADAYREYSEPWFGDRKVLRGGCFATTGRMIRNTWRNYREPHRRDTFSGLRTCAR